MNSFSLLHLIAKQFGCRKTANNMNRSECMCLFGQFHHSFCCLAKWKCPWRNTGKVFLLCFCYHRNGHMSSVESINWYFSCAPILKWTLLKPFCRFYYTLLFALLNLSLREQHFARSTSSIWFAFVIVCTRCDHELKCTKWN